MEYLYAPWRDTYITKQNASKSKCVFCEHKQQSDDQKYFIIKRFENCFINLNIFPYNAGHVMIVPYRHTSSLHALAKKTRLELIELVALSTKILKKVLNPEAFNVGTNTDGKAAGGSITDHLHMHVVPRWSGDTSFLTTISDMRPVSVDLEKIYTRLRQEFNSL